MPPPIPALIKQHRAYPRNGTEWAQAFRDADICDTVTAWGDDHSRNSIVLQAGEFVAVVPGGNRRDDALLQGQECVARVSRVALSGTLGPLVKLHWFYRHAELNIISTTNALTGAFVTSMGMKELLSLSCDTFDHADMVVRIVPVIEMSLTRPTFPIIDGTTLYFRNDFSLMRSWTKNKVTLLEGKGQLICSAACLFEGVYTPERDVIRYCTKCKRWFHIGCLKASDSKWPTLLPFPPSRPKQPELPKQSNDSVPMPGYLFTAMHYKFWHKMLLSPIQRGSSTVKFPLSFERLVDAIRSEQRSAGCPPDVFAFIDAELNVAPHLVDKAELYKAIFLELPKSIFYVCAWCPAAL
ncbi:hypothetical protein TRAPUB_2457 [Trametes pubescens]|uniref:BAH domain-containing protein n=1 Tax=Trametes pubescens TaxID=154538 RepID=A0A1M2VGG9_TRAPU|nr:hypothetical protein TRAPUB_2457 [Trametes pubescens]